MICAHLVQRTWFLLFRAFLLCSFQAALKKYQTEQRSKGDALEKCQAELKKLRKKSQGSKNPQKYTDKELQVGLSPCLRALPSVEDAHEAAFP